MQNSWKNPLGKVIDLLSIIIAKKPDMISFITISSLVFLSFGPFLNKLGYYIDDWKFLFWEFSDSSLNDWMVLGAYDSRPINGLFLYYTFSLLGRDPINWHVLCSVAKILTSFTFYLFLTSILKGEKKTSLIIASLFAVVPLFRVQPSALAYSYHWVTYFFYALSMLLLVYFLQKNKFVFLFLSVSLTAIHLTMEYFVGLEIFRPLIIFLLIEEENIIERIKKTIIYWVPYLFVLFAFGYFRWVWVLDYYPLPDNNELRFLESLINNPLSTLLIYSEIVIQDLIYGLVSSWSDVLSYDVFEITRMGKLKSIIISSIGGIFCYLVFSFYPEIGSFAKKKEKNILLFLLGLFIVMGGLIVGWMIGDSVTHSNSLTGTRFLLASTLGFCIFYFLFINTFIQSKNVKNIIFSILIAFSIAYHLNLANSFRWSWERQKDLYQQLYWRAPHIERHTMILSSKVLLPLVGEPFDAYAVNAMYYPKSSVKDIPLWFGTLNYHFSTRREKEKLLKGTSIDIERVYTQFFGNSQNLIVVDFQPENGKCLWVINHYDQFNPLINEDLYNFVSLTNFEKILSESTIKNNEFVDLISNNQENWCFFFEKADLALQNEDWDTIVYLWDEAKNGGHTPSNGIEFRPFIQGFAYSGNLEKAKELTLHANRITSNMNDYYCEIWGDIEKDMKIQEDKVDEVYGKLNCR
jgi:hypothetical protein